MYNSNAPSADQDTERVASITESPPRIPADLLAYPAGTIDTYWGNAPAVHENGKSGSAGYHYNKHKEEPLKLVLWTHTTIISTAISHKPVVMRGPDGWLHRSIFRNETVEDIITGYNLPWVASWASRQSSSRKRVFMTVDPSPRITPTPI
ncbi:hypothetical protein GGR58DRAFT_104220 [Xylaria digitata]|nr:hypothetical protein GGR58DRAFT_104220 [Xylaria digitata]